MKKAIVFVLVIVLAFSLAACGDEPELIGRILTHDDFVAEISKRLDLADYNVDDGSVNDYLTAYSYVPKTPCELEKSDDNFSIEVDGIKFNLPMTVGDFVDLGFEISHINPEETQPVNLNSNIYSAGFTATTPKGNTFHIFATTAGEFTLPIKDTTILSIDCCFYKDTLIYGVGERDDAPEIKFFKNITQTASIDSILKELKTPNWIGFRSSEFDGVVTDADIQIDFRFSNENYAGYFCISLQSVTDTSIERTSFVTDFSYRLDPETLK